MRCASAGSVLRHNVPVLYEFLNPDVPNLNAKQRNFRANRSMRDVETSVELEVKPLHEWGGSK